MRTKWLASVVSNWTKYSTDNPGVPETRYASTMSKLIITQTHSQIKCPQRQKATLKALGLGRIGKRAEVEGTPQILGMVEKVHHLVSVQKA